MLLQSREALDANAMCNKDFLKAEHVLSTLGDLVNLGE